MMARRGWFILLLLGAFFAIPVQRRFFLPAPREPCAVTSTHLPGPDLEERANLRSPQSAATGGLGAGRTPDSGRWRATRCAVFRSWKSGGLNGRGANRIPFAEFEARPATGTPAAALAVLAAASRRRARLQPQLTNAPALAVQHPIANSLALAPLHLRSKVFGQFPCHAPLHDLLTSTRFNNVSPPCPPER